MAETSRGRAGAVIAPLVYDGKVLDGITGVGYGLHLDSPRPGAHLGAVVGEFSSFDAATGTKVWHFNCGAGVNAPPISYEIDGKQYVAVAARGSQIWGFRQGGALVVFGLAD